MRTLLLTFFIFYSCSDTTKPNENEQSCFSSEEILSEFIAQENTHVIILKSGEYYAKTENNCQYLGKYFEPTFFENNYELLNGEYFIKSGTSRIPIIKDINESFTNYINFQDLFMKSQDETSKHWNGFTLQSPLAKTVDEYIELKNKILNSSGTFLDNRIDLVEIDSKSTIQFFAVKPSEDMITSKTSIESLRLFLRENDELWLETNVLFKTNLPFSIFDFENSFFEGSPGPRIVIRNNKIEFENKFGAKNNFKNNSSRTVSKNTWYKIKLHVVFHSTEIGLVEMWQDDEKIISEYGITLPTSNSVINRLEFGITATDDSATLFISDLRFSNSAF